MSARNLTERQMSVLKLIIAERDAGRPAPTMRDICAHVGWKSTNSAQQVVQALIKKGALTRVPGSARSVMARTNPHLEFFKSRRKLIYAMHKEGASIQQIVDRICISDKLIEAILASEERPC